MNIIQYICTDIMVLLIITIQHVPLGPIPWAVLLCCFLISNTRGNGPGSTLKAGGKCRMSSQHAGKVRVFMVLRWFSDLHQGICIITGADFLELCLTSEDMGLGWSWSRSDRSIVAGSAPYFDYPIRNKRCTEPASQGRGQNYQPL